MTWTILAPILAQYGFEFVDRIITNIRTKGDQPVTPEEWEALKGTIHKPLDEYLAEARAQLPGATPPAV